MSSCVNSHGICLWSLDPLQPSLVYSVAHVWEPVKINLCVHQVISPGEIGPHVRNLLDS